MIIRPQIVHPSPNWSSIPKLIICPQIDHPPKKKEKKKKKRLSLLHYFIYIYYEMDALCDGCIWYFWWRTFNRETSTLLSWKRSFVSLVLLDLIISLWRVTYQVNYDPNFLFTFSNILWWYEWGDNIWPRYCHSFTIFWRKTQLSNSNVLEKIQLPTTMQYVTRLIIFATPVYTQQTTRLTWEK